MLKNKKTIAQLGLLVTALIWGATFLIVKDALIEPYNCPPFIFSAMRFALASACVVFFLDFKLMRKNFLANFMWNCVIYLLWISELWTRSNNPSTICIYHKL